MRLKLGSYLISMALFIGVAVDTYGSPVVIASGSADVVQPVDGDTVSGQISIESKEVVSITKKGTGEVCAYAMARHSDDMGISKIGACYPHAWGENEEGTWTKSFPMASLYDTTLVPNGEHTATAEAGWFQATLFNPWPPDLWSSEWRVLDTDTNYFKVLN